MDDKNAINKNLKWLGAGNICQIGLSTIYFFALGFLLSVADFGAYSVIIGLVSIVSLFIELRMQDVASKYLCDLNQDLTLERKDVLSTDIAALYLIEGILKFLLLIVSPVILYFYSIYSNLPDNSYIPLMIASVGFFFMKAGSQLNLALLRLFERPEWLVGGVCLELLIRLFLIAALYITGNLTLISVICIFCLTGIILNLSLFFINYYLLKREGIFLGFARFEKIRAVSKKYKTLMITNYWISLSSLMNQDLDVSLLPFVISIEKIAVYKMAKNAAILVWKLIDPLSLVFLPKASLLASEKRFGELVVLARKMMSISFLLTLFSSFCLNLIIYFFQQEITTFGYAGLDSLVIVLTIAITLCSPLAIGHALLISQDKAKLTVYASILSSILGSFLLLTLPIYLDILGAAIAWGLSLALVILLPGAYSFSVLRRDSKEYNVEGRC